MSKKKKEVVNALSPEKTKEIILNSSLATTDTKAAMKKLREDILPRVLNGTKKEQRKAMEEYHDVGIMIMSEHENDTRVNLITSFNKDLHPVIRKLAKDIEKEYNCTTSLEKTLVGTIVNAYARVLDNSRRMNNQLNGDYITADCNKYISNLSMHIDRSHRQLIHSIQTLKQLKTPSIGINIKANTAFVAGNQQINNKKENNESK